MKGIAHFAVGVAAASCFPQAVHAGAGGNPLYFLLGGVFGLLPDTIDFKFSRFFHRNDIEIIPDPNKLDPQMIADAVALAVNKAHEIGKPVKLKLDTIRLGSNLWRQYEVTFDVARRRVCVSYGPVVDTGRAVVHRNDLRKSEKSASAPVACELKLDYTATTTIDIFDGPSFQMQPLSDGRIMPHFIPWHRAWSHSLVIGLVLALAGTVIWDYVAGLVIGCAYFGHILLDQLGFMGSNLLFPFQKFRIEGAKRLHSDDAFANLAVVWLSCMLIFWNLYCAMPWQVPWLNLARFLFYGALIPAALYLGARRLFPVERKDA